MYDRQSQFTKATREADQDYAAFGQTVIDVDLNRQDPRLIYQTYHLRDVAWTEDQYGQVDRVDRKWEASYAQAVRMFGKKNSSKILEKFLEYPNQTVCHIHVSWLNPRKVRQITVVGDREMVQIGVLEYYRLWLI